MHILGFPEYTLIVNNILMYTLKPSYLHAQSFRMILPILIVAPSEKRGRGVFAGENI